MSKTVWLITGLDVAWEQTSTSHPHSPMTTTDPFWVTPSTRAGKTTPRR